MRRILFSLLFLSVSASAALADVGLDDLFRSLKQQDWVRAEEIAKTLDAGNGKGDILKAFAKSFETAQQGNCETAQQLSQLVIRANPGFLPAYEVLAGCLVKTGKREQASQLYQNLSNALPDGPEKDLAERRADALKPDLSPRLGFDLSIIPSSNTSRRTSRSETGNGGALSDESRAQDGVAIVGNVLLTKPIFNTGRMLSQISLKAGASYETITETTRPVLGVAWRNSWILSPKAILYATPFYEYTWSSGERFFDEAGFRAGGTYRFNASTTASLDASASIRNFNDDARDANFVSVRGSIAHILGPQNKLQLSANFAQNTADNDFFNVSIYSLNIEWQHLFENGFITSVGGQVGRREFDRLAPFTTDERADNFTSATIGLSHRNFSFKGIRPELTYTYTDQSSSDLFNDFDAHDFGVRLRVNF